MSREGDGCKSEKKDICLFMFQMVMHEDKEFYKSFYDRNGPSSRSRYFKEFKLLYDGLSKDEKDYVMDSYCRCCCGESQSEEKGEILNKTEIEIPITHREYLNGCVKTVRIKKNGKEFISKIPISYSLPLEHDLIYQSRQYTVKFKIQNEGEWEVNGLDIIHTLNEEELQNKVVTLPCGKVVSIKRIDEEMTLFGFGLRSEDDKHTGNVILRTPREKNRKQLLNVAKKEKDGLVVRPGNGSTTQKVGRDDNLFFFYITKYQGHEWANEITTYIFYSDFFKFSVNIHYDAKEKYETEKFTKIEVIQGTHGQYPIAHIQILFAGYFETKKKAETYIKNSIGGSVDSIGGSMEIKQISKSKRYYSTQDYYYKIEFGMIPLIIPIPTEFENNKKGYLLFYNHLKNKTPHDFLLLEIIE